MKPVFYTTIDLYDGISEVDVIKRAHILGYELVPFDGFTDLDLGMPGNRGPRWSIARKNLAAIIEITDSLVRHYPDNTFDAIKINSTKEN
jgi:hypothetical protein